MCVTAPSGVPCAAESGDAMGTAVSVGDYNGDGWVAGAVRCANATTRWVNGVNVLAEVPIGR
ncbi:hypothetical protein [Streptomyces sp. NPDC057582]|uniref:hypothetical protein n=1 Tax=Streptomyces sp. NPDC057582 TaxID=3346174 RepID=UPI00369F2764